MGRHKSTGFTASAPSIQGIEITRDVVLELPPLHTKQAELVNAFDARRLPDGKVVFNSESAGFDYRAYSQLPLAYPELRFVVGACGTKFGKTYGSAIMIARQAWENHNSLNWWVAPSYGQSTMAYRFVKTLFPAGSYNEFKADLRLELMQPDGEHHSAIEFKSADNEDNLRGFGVNFAIVDEAARITEAARTSIFTTMMQTDGKCVFISTPKGRNQFFDDYCKGDKSILLSGEHDLNPEWLSIRMPTWANPYVKPSRIELMRKDLPQDVFKQEVAAQFMSESAGVFRGIEGCIKKGLVDSSGYWVNENPLGNTRYVIGVDLARKHDYTVIIVFDCVRKHVVYFARFTDLSWAIQKRRIVEVSNAYNRAHVVMDSTGIGDAIVGDVQASGVRVEPFIITNKSKQELIEKLRADIEFGRISYPQILPLIKELRNYEYKISSSGNIQYSAPPGQYDDTVIALALANHGLGIKHGIARAMQVRGV